MGSPGDMADPGAFGWVRVRTVGTKLLEPVGRGMREYTVCLKEGHIPLWLEELVDAQQTAQGHRTDGPSP